MRLDCEQVAGEYRLPVREAGGEGCDGDEGKRAGSARREGDGGGE